LKLLLAEPVIDRVAPKDTPRHIRLSMRYTPRDVAIGQRVSLRGGIFPLPRPALPGGFDFARHFYFQSIGAVGFGLRPITIETEAVEEGWQSKLKSARHNLTRKVTESLRGPEGEVAASLITGEQGGIPEEIKEAMRISGLAHILSISGLHLSLVAGVLFILIRYTLVLIPGLALRYPLKEWAAGLALLGSFGYLAIAGFPVPAQRAFMMVGLVLLAVMLDRQVLSMRSLALAAMVIMLWLPESVLSPSFQLSFAATMAILAMFESAWQKRAAEPWRRESLLYKPLLYFGVAFLTSLAAGLATTPFVMLHFNQFTMWHILANMAASPFLSLWVMPLVVLTLLAMPFGLDAPLFWLMGKGIECVLAIAYWVSSLPYAAFSTAAPPDWGMLLMILGGCWLCFWQQRWRWAGVPFLVFGMLSVWWVRPPDMLIAPEAAQIAYRLPEQEEGYTMLYGSRRNFNAGLWQESLGIEEWIKPVDAGLGAAYQCDALGCILTLTDGQTLAIPVNPEALAEDCQQADILITPFYHDCDAAAFSVERPKAAMALYFEEDGIPRAAIARSFIDRITTDPRNQLR